MWIVVAFFAAILTLFLGGYWVVVLRPESASDRALKRRLRTGRPGTTGATPGLGSLANEAAPLSTLPALDGLLRRSTSLVDPLEMLIERSALRLTVGQFVLATVFSAGLGFVLAWWVTREVLAGVVAFVLFACLPYFIVRFFANRRMEKFEEQFPEAIDLIARALRAGHALTTGLGMVAEEMVEPVGSEFRLLHDRQNFGMPFPEALRSFAERVPLLDARFFVTAVLTQRESGGNLAEVLDSLAALVRDRFRLKREVRTLSAHGRITGLILAALPIVLAAILFVIAPEHMSKLVTDPLGVRMVIGVSVLQVIGFLIMRRIVNIEV